MQYTHTPNTHLLQQPVNITHGSFWGVELHLDWLFI